MMNIDHTAWCSARVERFLTRSVLNLTRHAYIPASLARVISLKHKHLAWRLTHPAQRGSPPPRRGIVVRISPRWCPVIAPAGSSPTIPPVIILPPWGRGRPTPGRRRTIIVIPPRRRRRAVVPLVAVPLPWRAPPRGRGRGRRRPPPRRWRTFVGIPPPPGRGVCSPPSRWGRSGIGAPPGWGRPRVIRRV
jgi:hypothetical protein